MIKSFSDRESEQVWNGDFSPKLPNDNQPIASRKLRMINNAQIINDLRISSSNRLEKLKENLNGNYSIRINKQLQIVNRWTNNNAEEVKIEDYHD